jgi:hypothetical protein
MADYKEGVDFEIREVKGKDGKVLYKNRHFFSKAEKEAMKAPKPTPKADKAKAESKPKKSQAPSSSPRPKGKEETKATNMVRPEGKAAGMPAAKSKGVDKGTAAVAAVAAGGARAALGAGKGVSGGLKASAESGVKPTTAKPFNPSYTGKAGSPSGFQGRFETGVARAGGARVGGIPIGPKLRTKGGRIVKMPDILELQFMNKGGVVKKKGKK